MLKKTKKAIFLNTVFGSVALLCLAALVYTLYRQETLPEFFLYFYVVLFTTGGVISIVVILCLKEEWKVNIALSLISVVISLYCVEGFLWLTGYNPRVPRLAKIAGVPFDTRTKLEFIEDMQKKGMEVKPYLPPLLLVKNNGLSFGGKSIYPLGNISKKATVLCNESGQYVIIENDEHGFNNPQGLYRPGEIDIALVGDSFTQAWCVKTGEEIAGQLRKAGFTTLNLGSSGNGPLLELATLKEYLEPLQPNIVLWMYYEGNDLRDINVEKNSSILMSYLELGFSQKLIDRQKEIDLFLMTFIKNQEQQDAIRKRFDLPVMRFIKLQYLRAFMGLHNPILKKPESLPIQLFGEILALAKQQVSAWGGQLYFVYLPSRYRYEHNIPAYLRAYVQSRDEVLYVVKKNAIPVVDLVPMLDNHSDPLSFFPFREAIHYTKEAYALFANRISEHLLSEYSK